MAVAVPSAAAASAWGGGIGLIYWGFAFGLICALLFVCVYPLFVLTDLEADLINPIDACRKLNQMAKYEFGAQVGRPGLSLRQVVLLAVVAQAGGSPGAVGALGGNGRGSDRRHW